MNDKKLYLKALYYRNLCFNTDERFKHYDLGYNFRFTNLQVDLGLAQMTKIKDLIKKIQIAKNYINDSKIKIILPTFKIKCGHLILIGCLE